MMDGDLMLRVLPVVLMAAGLAWSVWLHRAGARREELERLRERIDKVEGALSTHAQDGQTSRAELRERLVEVEQTLRQMPTQGAVHELGIAVAEIRGDLRAQGETLKGIGATARRVEEFLLQRSGQT